MVLVSGLLAPWAFWLVQEAGQHNQAGSWLLKTPFRRVFDRTILVVAVIGLWPLRRRLEVGSWREIGFPRTPNWGRELLLGFLLGVGSFVATGWLLILVQARRIDPELQADAFFAQVPFFMLTAVLVALIEEIFFRGGLQGAFQRSMGPLPAIAVTSAIYSVVHFLKPITANVPVETVSWHSGFDHLASVLTQPWMSQEIVLGVVTLWLTGAILGLAFAKTNALYLPIGLHAGLVLMMKTIALCTQPKLSASATWWGGSALISNALPWPVLVAVLVLVNWICSRKPNPKP